MTTRRGQLLIASPRMLDPNFARSVVLIVRDDEDGALGVILNRPLEVSVGDAIASAVEAAEGLEAPVHQGGPCEGPLSVVHGEDAVDGEQVVEGVRFTMDREQIESIMRAEGERVKYIAGYAGWSANQLDGEIEEGAWVLAPAGAEIVFDDDETLWARAMTWLQIGTATPFARIPHDPSVN